MPKSKEPFRNPLLQRSDPPVAVDTDGVVSTHTTTATSGEDGAYPAGAQRGGRFVDTHRALTIWVSPALKEAFEEWLRANRLKKNVMGEEAIADLLKKYGVLEE